MKDEIAQKWMLQCRHPDEDTGEVCGGPLEPQTKAPSGDLVVDTVAKNPAFGTLASTYPGFLHDWLLRLDYAGAPRIGEPPQITWGEACQLCQAIYFSTTRYLALIALSFYLHDTEIQPDKRVGASLAFMALPHDSTWKEIILAVCTAYREQGRTNEAVRFPIQGFLESVSALSDRELGVAHAIRVSVKHPESGSASVLQAGVDLRNAIHHDSPLSEADYERVFPLYREIIERLLLGFPVLDGQRWALSMREETGSLRILHGQGFDADLTIPTPEHAEGTDVYLLDRQTSRIHPLYPFALKSRPQDGQESEYLWYGSTRKEIVFAHPRLNDRVHHREGYGIFRNLASGKAVELTFDLDKLDYRYLVALSLETSRYTLENSYAGTKYFPDAYLERASLRKEVDAFLAGSKRALVVTGGAGMGKSAFLAHVADTLLGGVRDESLPSPHTAAVLPLFLNGRDITRANNAADRGDAIFALIKRAFLLDSKVDTTRAFWLRVANVLGQAQVDPRWRLVLIVDAVNESWSTRELFAELDTMVSECASFNWLKVIYSVRHSAWHEVQAGLNESQSPFRNPALYHRVVEHIGTVVTDDFGPHEPRDPDEMRQSQEAKYKEEPTLVVHPLRAGEVGLMFKTYASNPKYFPMLASRDLDSSLVAGKEAQLSSPLYLKFYLRLLEQRGLNSIELGSEGEVLLGLYWEYLCTDTAQGLFPRHVRHFLESLGAWMLQDGTTSLPTADPRLHALVASWREEAEASGVHFYRDPLERLISEGILDRKTTYPVGEAASASITWNVQRMAEYCLFRHLCLKYGAPSKDWLLQLIEADTDFDEYSGAIELGMRQLWDEERIDELCQVPVTRRVDRYSDCFVQAVFGRYAMQMAATAGRDLLVAQFERRVGLIVANAANLDSALDLGVLFVEQGSKVFQDKVGGFAFWKICCETAVNLLEVNGGQDWFRMLAVSFLANMYASEGKLAAARELMMKNFLEIENIAQEEPANEYLVYAALANNAMLVDVLASFGERADALSLCQRNLSVIEGLVNADPTDERRRILAIAFMQRAQLHNDNGELETAHSLVCRSHEISEQVAMSNPGDSQLQRHIGVCHEKIADIHAKRGEFESALEHYRISCAIRERLLEADPDSEEFQRDLGVGYMQVAGVLEHYRELQKAQDLYARSLEIRERLAASNPASEQLGLDVSNILYALGGISIRLGDLDEGMAFCKQSLEMRERLASMNPDSELLARSLCHSYEGLALICRLRGDFHDAAEFSDRCIATRERISMSRHASEQVRRELCSSYEVFAGIHSLCDEPLKARILYQKSLELREQISLSRPDDGQLRRDIASCAHELALIHETLGEAGGAKELYRKSLAIREQLFEADPTVADLEREVDSSCTALGEILEQEGELDAARELFRKSLSIRENLLGADSASQELLRNVSIGYDNLAGIHEKLGDLGAAQDLYKRSLVVGERLLQEDPSSDELHRDLSISYDNLAVIHRKLGEFAEARNLYQKSLAVRERRAQARPSDDGLQRGVSVGYNSLAGIYSRLGELDLALELYLKSLTIREKLAHSHPESATARRDLAFVYRQLIGVHSSRGSATEAEELQAKLAVIEETLAGEGR